MKRLPRKLKKECKKLLWTYYDDALILNHDDNMKLTKLGQFVMNWIAPCFEVGYYDENDWLDETLYHPCKKHMEIYDKISKDMYKIFKKDTEKWLKKLK